MSERILGRAAELQQVDALLADEAPEARALVLTGDAGVGKTTIWEEGVRLAGERGLRVLAAGPAEGEAALPFAALGDLLGPVVDSVELPQPQRIALGERSSAPTRTGRRTGSRSRVPPSGCCWGWRATARSSWRSTTCSGWTRRRSTCSPSPCGGSGTFRRVP